MMSRIMVGRIIIMIGRIMVEKFHNRGQSKALARASGRATARARTAMGVACVHPFPSFPPFRAPLTPVCPAGEVKIRLFAQTNTYPPRVRGGGVPGNPKKSVKKISIVLVIILG